MENSEKHIVVNLQKVNVAFSFSLLLFMAFLAACSTPTVSSSDSDEKSSSSEKVEKRGDLSSPSNMSIRGESSSSSVVTLATPCKTKTEDSCEYGELTDERDGQTYKTVKIGDQWWMAENMNYADSVKTPSLLERNWCYDNNPSNCAKYGRLYTWAAAIDSVALVNDADNPQDCGYDKTCTLPEKVRGVCPEDWHVPTNDEWETLFAVVGGWSTAGKKLKSLTDWYAYSYISNEDAYGFSAQPGGYRIDDGSFDGAGYHAYIWNTMEGERNAGYMYLLYNYDYATQGVNVKYYGFSVRCVKD